MTSKPLSDAVEQQLQKLLKKSNAPSAQESTAQAIAEVEQHCGSIAIVGRPNVGKSTLLNALVGQKISITSRKAQTTRHRITGIRTHDAHQFVFVDTPGFQTKHSNALNKTLNKAVSATLADVAVVVLVLEAGYCNDADIQVIKLLPSHVPVLLVANKLDTIKQREQLAPWLLEMQAKHDFAELIPMSAKSPKDIERLLHIIAPYLPQQTWWYAPDELTDKNERFLATEIVREKLFRLTGDELPYTSTVMVEQFQEKNTDKAGKRTLHIAASIIVERSGHKAMVIGNQGERIKRIGTDSRIELERLFNAKVFIELWVKVRSGWADDENRLRSFGYG